MRTIEKFEHYKQAINRGVPYLDISIKGKSGTAFWTDGTLIDYDLFRVAVDSTRMDQELTELFHGQVPKTRRNAVLSRGSVIGSMSRVPPEVAEQAFEIVKRHFNEGLHLMLDCGLHRTPMFWEGKDLVFEAVRRMAATRQTERAEDTLTALGGQDYIDWCNAEHERQIAETEAASTHSQNPS